jgi:hypothetical protein
VTLDFKTKGLLVSDWPYPVRIFQVTFNVDKGKIHAYEIVCICHRLDVYAVVYSYHHHVCDDKGFG